MRTRSLPTGTVKVSFRVACEWGPRRNTWDSPRGLTTTPIAGRRRRWGGRRVSFGFKWPLRSPEGDHTAGIRICSRTTRHLAAHPPVETTECEPRSAARIRSLTEFYQPCPGHSSSVASLSASGVLGIARRRAQFSCCPHGHPCRYQLVRALTAKVQRLS